MLAKTPADLAAELLATLGDTYTVNGDACSPYFTLVLNTETQADISVSLIDERAQGPKQGYPHLQRGLWEL